MKTHDLAAVVRGHLSLLHRHLTPLCGILAGWWDCSLRALE